MTTADQLAIVNKLLQVQERRSANGRDNYLAKIPAKVCGDLERFCAAELTFIVWCSSSGFLCGS